jgi:hypothetical protein
MSDQTNTENPKEYLGREKDCVSKIPMRLMLRLAKVHKLGAEKYGTKNWRLQPVRMSTYYDAIFRHLVEWYEGGEDMDVESKEHHLLHVIACSLIILDGIEHKSIRDDRDFAEVLTGKLASPPPSNDDETTRKVTAIEALVAAAGTDAVRKSMDPAALAEFEASARANIKALKSDGDTSEDEFASIRSTTLAPRTAQG